MGHVDIDAMLHKAGDFGCYQIYLMVLFSFVNVVCAYHYFSQTFISVIPEHWCNSTELSSIRTLNDTIVDFIRHQVANLSDQSCTRQEWNPEPGTVNGSAVECDTGWIYNRDNGFESIVSELNWVCKEDWKSVIGQSTFFVGSVLGTMGLGVLSDRIGRLPVLSIANTFAFIGNISTIFANSLPAFASCRFISGLATDCNFMMMYIIVMEYVRPSMRTFGLNLCIGVFYCLGCVTVPLVAMALTSWRLFLLATSLPIVVIVCFYFVFVLLVALLASPALSQYHAQPQQHSQPQHYSHHEPEHYAPPKYEFHYKVEDEHTGDYKEQEESRDGDVTKGFYWLIDADGYRRHVEYIVDGKSGFQAKVTREPTSHKPAPPAPKYAAAPAHYAPAPVHYAPAPVHHAPAPVQHAPAPVHHAPAPVHHAPAPVHHAPAPVHYAPAPVQHAPAPVHYAPAPAAHYAPAPIHQAPSYHH